MKTRLIVGLEIHIQLATRTKLFCGCKLGFNDPPNSNVCPVCLGMPGALPVMNIKAYEYAVLAALALDCEIVRFTKWDRKGYYYPDLPKNYQISQYDLPASRNGFIDIPLEGGLTKKVRILRAHLEEDAGKNMHEGLYSHVDLNRAGTPLLEIVTQPDLNSPAECRILAIELQKLVQFLGVSQANMQQGHMRFEPNINVEITDDDGREYRTPICEVKNLNSFRALEQAVAYEEWRQIEQWKDDHGFTKENFGKQNRGWDDCANKTVFQREKEESHDYRYFPDPDLVPVRMNDEWLSRIKSRLCELPLAARRRFMADYGLSDYDAGVLTAERSTAEFFDAAVKAGGAPKRTANIVTQFGLKIANERACAISEIGISPQQVAELARLVELRMVSASAAATIFERMLTDRKDPQQIASENNLIQQSDGNALKEIVEQVISDNTEAVEEIKTGGKKSKKLRAFLLGQVMQKTKGRANPVIAGKLLDEKLGSS